MRENLNLNDNFPCNNFVAQNWYPAIDGDRCAVFTAEDLRICNIKMYKRLYIAFKFAYAKISNVELAISTIVQKVESKWLLVTETKQ